MQATTLMRALATGAAGLAAAATVAVLGPVAGAAAAGTGPAVLAFRPAPYHYGKVLVGQRSAETFTLANTGGRSSGALRVTVSGPAAFSITADTCRASLAPGKTCTVRVRFAPARAGAVTATLRAVSKNRAAVASDALAGAGQGLGGAPGHVYWANANNDTIDEVPLTGGTVSHLDALGVSHTGWRRRPTASSGPTSSTARSMRHR
jgi:Abnormal spindle-like microcephaly-assoc'd, ASPM-SPD-2-Hydin